MSKKRTSILLVILAALLIGSTIPFFIHFKNLMNTNVWVAIGGIVYFGFVQLTSVLLIWKGIDLYVEGE